MIVLNFLLRFIVDRWFIFTYSFMQDEPRLREVLKFANACGAITTTKKGAIPALPKEDDVLSLIKGSAWNPSIEGLAWFLFFLFCFALFLPFFSFFFQFSVGVAGHQFKREFFSPFSLLSFIFCIDSCQNVPSSEIDDWMKIISTANNWSFLNRFIFSLN